MRIKEILKICLYKKYADFSGKACRSEYWLFWTIYIFFLLGIPLIAFIINDLYQIKIYTLLILWIIAVVGLTIPFFAVSVRRLHDSGLSGWHFFWRFIPYIGSIITIVLMLRKSCDEAIKIKINNTPSKNKTMYYLRKVIFTSIIIGFGFFSELLLVTFEYYENAILYFPVLSILTTYYIYLIWEKGDMSVEDILLRPLLNKVGLFCETTKSYSLKKKLFNNVVPLLISMIVIFLIILVLPSPKEGDISIGNILLLLPIIGWIVFLTKEFGAKWSSKTNRQIDCINTQQINIFSSLPKAAPETWAIKEQRSFTEEEINAVLDVIVVSGKFGKVVQFTLEGGCVTYIPLDQSSTLSIGDKIDIKSALLLTLWKKGENDIYRILA